MRTRTRGSSYTQSVLTGHRSISGFVNTLGELPPAPAVTPATSRSAGRSDLESISDYVTPGYFRTSRDGGTLPVNDLSMSRLSSTGYDTPWDIIWRRAAPSGSRFSYVCRHAVTTSSMVGFAPVPLSYPVVPEGQANTNALADLRDQLWDAGTALAEFGKTANTVFGVGSRILSTKRRLMASIKRKDSKTAAQVWSEFNQLWLEGRYAWRPLFHDIVNATEAFNNMKLRVVPKRGSANVSGNTKLYTTWTSPVQELADFQTRWEHSVTVRYRSFCGGYVDLSKPAHIDPLLTAWELVPYSFVVDWFVNIGSAIQAYSPFAVGDLKYAGYTREVETISVLQHRLNFNTSGLAFNEFLVRGTGLTCSRRTVTRRPINPTLSVQFNPRLNAFKAYDLVALVSQLLSRKK